MKQLVYGNQRCPETIEELQRVEVAAATFHSTLGVFLRSVQTCYDVLKPVLLVKDNIFNISCKKVVPF